MKCGSSAIALSCVVARVEAPGDDLADERLPRDDADEALVLGDVDGAHLGSLQELARHLRGGIGGQLARVRNHRLADRAHGYGKIPRAWSAFETSRTPVTSAPVRSDT